MRKLHILKRNRDKKAAEAKAIQEWEALYLQARSRHFHAHRIVNDEDLKTRATAQVPMPPDGTPRIEEYGSSIKRAQKRVSDAQARYREVSAITDANKQRDALAEMPLGLLTNAQIEESTSLLRQLTERRASELWQAAKLGDRAKLTDLIRFTSDSSYARNTGGLSYVEPPEWASVVALQIEHPNLEQLRIRPTGVSDVLDRAANAALTGDIVDAKIIWAILNDYSFRSWVPKIPEGMTQKIIETVFTYNKANWSVESAASEQPAT